MTLHERYMLLGHEDETRAAISAYDYDRQFFHAIGMPVKMEWSESDQEHMPYGSFWTHEGDPHYDRLRVTSQGSTSDGRLYGFEVEYEQVTVKLYDAERMIKVLRSIHRKMEKIRDDLGYPTGFPDYLARAGKAMGISQYGFLPLTGPTFVAGHRYQWHGATMLDTMINQRVKALREAAGVEVA